MKMIHTLPIARGLCDQYQSQFSIIKDSFRRIDHLLVDVVLMISLSVPKRLLIVMTKNYRIIVRDTPKINPLTCSKRVLPSNPNTVKHTVVINNSKSNKNVQIRK